MNFTFGIITNGLHEDRVWSIIDSIREQRIDSKCYEIIVVGGKSIHANDVTWLSFDESARDGWITRKKNLIAEWASFDNLTIAHDYIAYDKDWYKNFVEFGSDWDVAMNKLENLDGSRFRDWTISPMKTEHIPEFRRVVRSRELMLPYQCADYIWYQYISGSYFVVKRDVLLEIPLNESLYWGDGEDVEWYERLLAAGKKYRMNDKSTCKFLKQKWNNDFGVMQQDTFNELQSLGKFGNVGQF